MDRQSLNLSASIIALSALGIEIEQHPGEYRVSYTRGGDQTARFADSLAEAVKLGGDMAAERPESPRPAPRQRRTTRRAMIRRHNRAWGARVQRQKAKERADAERRALISLSFRDE